MSLQEQDSLRQCDKPASCSSGQAPKRFVYADNAATTEIAPEVLEAMLPWLQGSYGNANGFYGLGVEAKRTLESCRARVAQCINADPREIFFTSGGTECDNWAIRGTLEAQVKKGKHVITSAIEHHAITHTLDHLKKKGLAEVTYLPVDEKGQVNPADLEAAIRPDTVLVTIMRANNEIGTVLATKELAEIAHKHNIWFHTDAVQAVGHIPLDVKELGVDMISSSAHKFHGPKGVGFMYIKRGVRLPALLTGGGHESNRRSGTENIAGIVGLTTALERAVAHLPQDVERLSKLRDKLMDEITARVPYCYSTGDRENRLPGIASVAAEFVEGESLTLLLDANGVCVSSGSACSSGDLDPSHVLLSIGLIHEQAHGSVRLSLSDMNTEEDVDYIISIFPGIVEKLRQMSPMWEDKISSLKDQGITDVADDPEAFAHQRWGYDTHPAA